MDRVGAAIRKARELQAASDHRTSVHSREPWAELTVFAPDPAVMARNRIVTFGRSDPTNGLFELLRTKLLRLMRKNGWTSVGITSPTSGCGKTTTSLNLAFSFARLDLRTMLIDLDLHRPAVARSIGLERPGSMAEVLLGARPATDAFVRCGENLAIGCGVEAARRNSDILPGAAAAAAISGLRRQFAPEVLLYDLPPMLVTDDVLAFAPHLDCVLLVAGAEKSRLDEIDACVNELEGQLTVFVIVNKCRYREADFEYA